MRSFKQVFVVLAASVAALTATAPAHADFGITPGNGSFTFSTGASTAGGHPDVVTRIEINRKDPAGDATLPANRTYGPDGTIRDLDLDLPAGLLANPTALETCTMGDVQLNVCPVGSAAGDITSTLWSPGFPGTYLLPGRKYRLWRINPGPAEAAAFAATLQNFPIRIGVTIGPDGRYRAHVQMRTVNETTPLMIAEVRLWGVPADHQGPGPITGPGPNNSWGGTNVGATRKAFTILPTACDGRPLEANLAMRSWQNPGVVAGPYSASAPAVTGCATAPFDPSITVAPSTRAAGKPAGYTVALSVPQSDDPDTQSTANLKDATVTLPEGVAISPPAADGLQACTDAQLAIDSSADEQCPDASKVGTVKIDTPLLDHPVDGSVYIGEQKSQDPQSGDMYRIFLTATDPGVKVKLRGQIKADSATGQLTTTFLDNPQIPFSKLTLAFKDGDRAPLVNPTTCGVKTATGKLDSWAGHSKDVSTTFTIDQDCPTGGFAPTFEAGTTNAMAGAFAPFTMTIRRNDGDQDLSQIGLDLPPGLLGALGSVPLCGEEQAAAGTCDESTRVGSTAVAAGTGNAPYHLPGKVYLAGPYKGAPFSMSIVVPAKAGPFDLGRVVVRSPLQVDANKAKVAAPADPLPRIVGGVPLHLRMVNIALDRAGFIFNATSCQPMAINATLQSTEGTTASLSSPYQAQGCDKVVLDPQLSMTITGGKGEMGKFKHPGVSADLSQVFGQSGLKKVQVKLPVSLALDAAASNRAGALCEPTQAAARNCPESSKVGEAVAETPALHEPLRGPIYFVRGERIENGKVVKTLPGLYIKLDGEGVPLDLRATSATTRPSKTVPQMLIATFDEIPDAPIKRFRMTVNAGKNGILQTAKGVCVQPKVATVTYEGHTGGTRTKQVTAAAPDCGFQIASTSATQRMVTVRVTGIGAGRLELTGSRLAKSTRTINKADSASIKALMTRSTRRSLARGKKVKVALAIRYRPSKGKTVTTKKTIVVKGKKAAKKAR